jgi:hypothetical protein
MEDMKSIALFRRLQVTSAQMKGIQKKATMFSQKLE